MKLTGFNANEHAETYGETGAPSEPIPAGLYQCLVESTEEKTTKAGTGSYLEVIFLVINNEHQGRKVWGRYNLNNPSDVAVRIAKKEFSLLLHAINLPAPNDSSELHDKPLCLKVGVKKHEWGGKERITNEIEAYYPFEHYEKQISAVEPTTTAAGAAPWEK